MEAKLYDRLDLHENATVLDAGSGSGLVAAYMAEHGLRVHAIDLIPTHVQQAQRTIRSRRLQTEFMFPLETTMTSPTSKAAPSMEYILWRVSYTQTIRRRQCAFSGE